MRDRRESHVSMTPDHKGRHDLDFEQLSMSSPEQPSAQMKVVGPDDANGPNIMIGNLND